MRVLRVRTQSQGNRITLGRLRVAGSFPMGHIERFRKKRHLVRGGIFDEPPTVQRDCDSFCRPR